MANRRLELSWPNKDKRLLSHGATTYEWVEPSDWRVSEVRLLEHVQDVGESAADNLVIHGDALHALTSLTSLPELAERYLGKVKLCYIDPPFNTGQTFAQYDDAVEHSVWLTMLRDRLAQIRRLLSADGSVWVHLDDAEAHRARSVLDEVFGHDNFVGQVIWEKTTSGRNDAKLMSVDQDYILVYAKDATQFAPNQTAHTAAADAAYKNPDDDPRGPWREVDYKGPKTADERPNLYYPLTHPTTGAEVWPRKERVWAYGREEHARHLRENLLWWGKTGNYSFPKLKKFLSERKTTGTPPRTLWKAEECDTTRRAKDEVKALFPGTVPFATPKPERLLERVLTTASAPGDIVLDCFAGSGTTAAVAHKMGRRYITVELSQDTLDTFVVPRLQKVVDGSDRGGISVPDAARVPVEDLPEGVTVEQVKATLAALKALNDNDSLDGLLDDTWAKLEKRLRALAKTTTAEADGVWTGGGGFRVLRVAPSMFEADDDGDLMLAEWAVGGDLARAVCAQLRYTYAPDGPFAGVKGRSRLAVLDGMLTEGVADLLLSKLEDKQGLCVVAQAIDPGVEDRLRKARPGSKARKMPRDLARAGILPSQVVELAPTPDGVRT